MENYDKILNYASSQQSFASYYNSGHENPLTVYQIVSFEIVEENIHEIQYIFKDYSSRENIKFYVEGKNIILDDLELGEDSIDEKFEFRIEHKLQNLLYPLIFSNVEEFKKFVTECIINLKIISINEIEKKICIKILGTTSLDMSNSLLFENEKTGVDFSFLLDTFVLESQYKKNSCLSIPNLLPKFLIKDNKIKILKAFLQCVCESELNSNEFLVNFSEVNRIIIPENLVVTDEMVDQFYKTIIYIYKDNKSYLEKLWIYRKKMIECLREGWYVGEIPWNRILQATKNNYYILINNSIENYLSKKKDVEHLFAEISKDIYSEINSKIESAGKEILTVIGALLSSFALKIDMEQQLIFIVATLVYCIFLYVIHLMKGFHISSESIKTKIAYLKEDLGEIYNIEKKYYDNLEEERVLPHLDKLHKIETFYKAVLIILILIIVLFFIIA